MYWVATEDVVTCEVTDFEEVDAAGVLYLMDGYKVDLCNPEHTRVQDVEDGQRIVYDGVIYMGGFGFNLWVMHKYHEM